MLDPNIYEELSLTSREVYIPSKNGFLVIKVVGTGMNPVLGIWADYDGNFTLTQQQVGYSEAEMTVCLPVKKNVPITQLGLGQTSLM